MLTCSSSHSQTLLALHQCRNLNDKQRCSVLSHCRDSSGELHLSSDRLLRCGLTAAEAGGLMTTVEHCRSSGEASALCEQGVTLLALGDDDYPPLLAEIADPPPVLFVKGDASALLKPQVAIVGSRNTSAQGRDNAFRFARALASAGCVVSSGLALGIDTEAHRGAVQGGGQTVAVLGTGINRVYPRQNRALAEAIVDSGAVVSELPPDAGPLRHHFPRRNRIISGLSLGVLVVEAALKSGSLITARMALEQGREVFAIPGSIHNPGSRGCHQLIRDGATLVERVDHIFAELSGWRLTATEFAAVPAVNGASVVKLSTEETALLAALGYDPVDSDTLLERSGWALPDMMAALAGLELKGLVENIGGNYQLTLPVN